MLGYANSSGRTLGAVAMDGVFATSRVTDIMKSRAFANCLSGAKTQMGGREDGRVEVRASIAKELSWRHLHLSNETAEG